jgi:hypothetical protein
MAVSAAELITISVVKGGGDDLICGQGRSFTLLPLGGA